MTKIHNVDPKVRIKSATEVIKRLAVEKSICKADHDVLAALIIDTSALLYLQHMLEAERDAAAADVARMIELCNDAKACKFCAYDRPNAGGPGEDGCGRGREGCIPEWRGLQKGAEPDA